MITLQSPDELKSVHEEVVLQRGASGGIWEKVAGASTPNGGTVAEMPKCFYLRED